MRMGFRQLITRQCVVAIVKLGDVPSIILGDCELATRMELGVGACIKDEVVADKQGKAFADFFFDLLCGPFLQIFALAQLYEFDTLNQSSMLAIGSSE